MSEEILADNVQENDGVQGATPEQAAPQTDFSSLINPDGSFKDEFYSSLPEGIGEHGAVKKYKTVPDLVKGHINANSMIGKKAEEFLKSEDPEIVSKRNEWLGIPDEYNFTLPEKSDEIPYNEDAIEGFKQKAKEIGLSQKQAQDLLDWDFSRAGELQEGVKQQLVEMRDKAEETLKADWGRNYQPNLQKVKQATDYLGITEVLEQTGLGNEPMVLKAVLDKIVPAISDDNLIEGTMRNNLETVYDTMRELDKQLLTHPSPQSQEYRTLLSKKEELLAKMV